MEKQMRALYVLLTRDCNMACSYCFQRRDHLRSPKSVDDVTFTKFLNYLVDYGITHVTLLGGEAFVDEAHLRATLQVCLENDIQATFITNGTIFYPWLVEYKKIIGNIQISVDGYGKSHDKNRVFVDGRPTFDIVIENANKLAELGFQVSLHSVITENNYHDLMESVPKLVRAVPKLFMFGFGIEENLSDNSWATIKVIRHVYKAWYKYPVDVQCRVRLPYMHGGPETRVCGAGTLFYSLDLLTGDFIACHHSLDKPADRVGSLFREPPFDPEVVKELAERHELGKYGIGRLGRVLNTFFMTLVPITVCWYHAENRRTDPYGVNLGDLYVGYKRSSPRLRLAVRRMQKKLASDMSYGDNIGKLITKLDRKKNPKDVRKAQKLYDEACGLMEKYHPCEGCKTFCCDGCTHLNEHGCTTKSLVCKLFLCKTARERLPKQVCRRLDRMVVRAVRLGYRMRQADEELA